MRISVFALVVVACGSAYAQVDILPPEAPSLPIPLTTEGDRPTLGQVVPGQLGVAGADASWRYRNHNGKWWYWLPSNRWVVWNGSAWGDYVAPTYSAQPTYSVQPYTTYRYGYDSSYSGGYGSGSRYGSGYNGYYSPGYGVGIYLGGQNRYGYGNYGNRGYGNNRYGYDRGGYSRGGYGRGRW